MLLISSIFYTLFTESFILYFLIIGITCLFVTYKKLFPNQRVEILQPIDFKINGLLDFYYSIGILALYFSIFFVSIIILRLNNLGRSIDLWFIILKVYDFFKVYDLTYIIIYISFIICMIIWILKAYHYISKLIRFHANRLHILFSETTKKSTPYNKIPTFVLYNDDIIATTLYGFFKSKKIIPKKYSSKVFVKLLSLEENLGLITFFIALFYDLVFNNMTLHYIFYLLPFIFIYKLYRDFLYFYNSRLYFDNYDCALYNLIYEGSLKKHANEEIKVLSLTDYVQRDFKPEIIKIC